MKKVTLFDLLVVYTHGIATSAATTQPDVDFPFSSASRRTNYNDAYAYFLETCAKNNLSAAFTTSADLESKGIFKSFWIYRQQKWIKVVGKCFSRLIFDKFSPINEKQQERRKSLFANSTIKPFNSPELFTLFFDKQVTYLGLADFTLPTVLIEGNNRESAKVALTSLKEMLVLHPQRYDFSKKVVIKDRHGAGGNNIYSIGIKNQIERVAQILLSQKNTSFVLQPFIRFEKGYSYKNYKGFIDIRIIYSKGKLIQAYIRTAKKQDFRCNEHQGGSLEYISKRDIPLKVLRKAQEVVNFLQEKNSLFALDFVISNNGNVYLMEGNCGPGIDWNLSLPKNERMAKKLIREIVRELALRVHPPLVPVIQVFDKDFVSLQY